jgi:Ca-activated chloride channel homolog
MEVEFLRPAYLLLILLLPLLWFLPRWGAEEGAEVVERGARLRAFSWRAAAMLLLILAAARPVLLSESDEIHRVLVLDRGPSVSEADAAKIWSRAGALLASVPDGEQWHVLHLATPERQTDPHPEGAREWRDLDPAGEAPFGSLLRRAGDLLPEGSAGAITYLGRGASSSVDWAEAVADLGARQIPVDTLDLGPEAASRRPEIRSLRPLEELRVGQETTLRLRFTVPAVATANYRFRLSEGDQSLVESEAIALEAGREDAALDLRFSPPRSGFLNFRAEIFAADEPEAALASIDRELAVQDPLRLLYLGHRTRGGAAQLGRQLGAGFAVEAPPEGELPNEEDLRGYHAVVLDDRPASTLGTEFMSKVAEAVRRDGVGLFACGGSGAFGPGGWHDTPLSAVLPVEMVQKEEKKDPSTALAIIIDTSGSMGGNRIRLAKEVTRLAIRRLLPHDKIGIVEFYGNKRWAAPLQSAANSIEIQRALNRLDAGGGTVLFPALEEAYYGMRNVQTRYKHVLILTDAGVETGPYEALLRRMARDGICVSTVLTGPGRHSDFLVQLADWGGGRYYNASNRFNLPEIMLKQPSTARLPAYRPGEVTVKAGGGTRWWGDIDRERVPPLAGYVETRARAGAERVLDTERDGHPILASWRYGLGRSTAFTTEPSGPGTEPWRDWEEGASFLGRALRATSSLAREPYRYALRRDGADYILRAESLVAGAAPPQAERLLEGDDAETLSFERRAPGTYVARGHLDRGASLRILAGREGSRRRLGVPAAAAYPGPKAEADGGRPELSALAAATGGESLAFDAAPGAFSTSAAVRPRSLAELRPWLLILGLLIYLADVLRRRWPRLRSDAS